MSDCFEIGNWSSDYGCPFARNEQEDLQAEALHRLFEENKKQEENKKEESKKNINNNDR